ncbi:MAG: hypothetical protein Q4G58_08715 [bacterium]|nr:hypothetical protein [bacterium]
MVQEWFENNIFTYIVLGIFAAGFLMKCLISLKYRTLIRASKRMGTSKNKLMRVLRLKFETCYKIKLGVNNVDTFVDKYVYRHRLCGIKLYTWETISGEFVILCSLVASIFALLGVFYDCGRNQILSTLAVGILSSAVLIAVDFVINLRMKRLVLRTNIKDYLENFLKARLESDEFSAELLDQYKKEYFDMPKAANVKLTRKERREKAKQEKQERKIKAAEIKALKKEKGKQEVDPGIKRREAKKKELKELIAADKQKKQMKQVKQMKQMKQIKQVKEDVPVAVAEPVVEEKQSKVVNEEIAVSDFERYKSASKKVNAKKPIKDPSITMDNITEEEAKVIEDILKEYLL